MPDEMTFAPCAIPAILMAALRQKGADNIRRYHAICLPERLEGGRLLPRGFVRALVYSRHIRSVGTRWSLTVGHAKALDNDPADRLPTDDECDAAKAILPNVSHWREVEAASPNLREFIGR